MPNDGCELGGAFGCPVNRLDRRSLTASEDMNLTVAA